MGITTFTGPVKAGTVLGTSGTTLGRDVANVGFVLMSQTKAVTQAASAGQAAGVYKTDIVIPAGSQIVEITLFKTAAWDGVAQTINVGTSATATELAVAGNNDASTTAGILNIIPGDSATRTGVWVDVGATDVRIWMKSTNTGAGTGYLTVRYLQAINLV